MRNGANFWYMSSLRFTHIPKIYFVSFQTVLLLTTPKILQITNGELSVVKTLSKSKIDAIADQEIHECYNKAENVGRWFAQMGAEENIYAVWGVKP